MAKLKRISNLGASPALKREPGAGNFVPEGNPNIQSGANLKLLQGEPGSSKESRGVFPWPDKTPNVIHFVEMLIHRYLTMGERSWLLLSDGSDASKRLQVVITSMVQTFVSQLHERIAVVMLDALKENRLSSLFPSHPFEIPSKNLELLEHLSVQEKAEMVGLWKIGEEVKHSHRSIVEARERYASLLINYDFVIAFANNFGVEEGGYHDPLRLQAIRNIDRVYFVIEMGRSRSSEIQKQLEVAKVLDLPIGEALFLDSGDVSRWLNRSWEKMRRRG